jgi:hypothetical protein
MTGWLRAIAAMFTGFMLLVQLFPINSAFAVSGAIWTTLNDCGDSSQNVNHYSVGETVYINAENFDVTTSTAWEVKGQPGGASEDPDIVVASGDFLTDASGSACFAAYTVLAGDGGEYKVSFGNKNDNFQVDGDEEEEECLPSKLDIILPD